MARPRNTSGCSVDGCSSPVVGWGWCRMHYYRWKRHGTTTLPKQPTVEEKFWSRVDKNGPVHPVCGQCWMWTAGKIRDGYGVITFDGKAWKAHRYSYTLKHGPIANDICVLHRCDNPSCVNPDHLFLGTYTDNAADRDQKGRQARGETSSASKFTEEEIHAIRARYIFGSSTDGSTAIARDYHVPHHTILCIVKRKTWRHV